LGSDQKPLLMAAVFFAFCFIRMAEWPAMKIAPDVKRMSLS
jgi:hypothetical protein